MDLLTINQQKQDKIKRTIQKLENVLQKTKITGFLLESSQKGPKLIVADRLLGKYQYLTERVIIPKLQVTLFPIWLDIPCTHPSWSKDIRMVNLIYEDTQEILIDGIYRTFQCSYSKAVELITLYQLSLPIFCLVDYLVGTNIIVDFEASEEISASEHKKKRFCLRNVSDDQEMMINTARVKFILIV